MYGSMQYEVLPKVGLSCGVLMPAKVKSHLHNLLENKWQLSRLPSTTYEQLVWATCPCFRLHPLFFVLIFVIRQFSQNGQHHMACAALMFATSGLTTGHEYVQLCSTALALPSALHNSVVLFSKADLTTGSDNTMPVEVITDMACSL